MPGGRSGERSPAGVAGHGAALCSALPGWHELQPRSCPSARGRRLRALLLGELPHRCALEGPAGLGDRRDPEGPHPQPHCGSAV